MSIVIRIFANHPLVEACYFELLASHSDFKPLSGFEPTECKCTAIGIFDYQPSSSLQAALVLSRRKFPALRPLLMLPPCDEHATVSWLRAGVCGIVPYNRHKQDLNHAILHIANGGLWFPAHIFRQSIGSERVHLGSDNTACLTSREQDVISLLLLMRSNKEIAEELRITERTAKFHVSNILQKTGAKSRQTLLNLFPYKTLA